MRQKLQMPLKLVLLTGLMVAASCGGATAQWTNDGGWNPFKWLEPAQPGRKQVPGSASQADLDRQPRIPVVSGPIETVDLAPVAASDEAGLPLDLWRGLSVTDLEQLLAAMNLPPRSPTLHQIWRRMLSSAATPPSGASADHFLALRLEALYRSGLLEAVDEVSSRGAASNPLAQVILSRKLIGVGASEQGCRAVASVAAPGLGLRGSLKGEAQLLAGYCAAVQGNAAAAGLAANLAREEGATDVLALHVLDSLSLAAKVRPDLPTRVSLLEYRFLKLLGSVGDIDLVERAEPALLVVLASPESADPRVRTAAAEAALRLNALNPPAAAEVYRMAVEGSPKAPAGETLDPVTRRARLLRAVEATQAPELRGQLLRALLEDARRAGVHLQTARMLVPVVAELWPSPETSTLAEPITEIGVAAGDYDLARRWAETSPSLQHWLALIELANERPRRGRPVGLSEVEELAARGRLNGEFLHRLVTVLDALDLEVPMPLWEASGRVPQPVSGYLPETGVLTELQQVSQRKETGRTVLLAMRAIGPNTAGGASILALGDTIRALKRVGLEADARRLGVEALVAVWPRTPG